uniref:Uncharacterized protein n=1 Tax=Panagrolaimus sp. ES5 TaxID=591445 RepID=A0AC34G2Q5_9BILA
MPWHSEQNLIGFGERHNSTDEAMILQPRRRRFMSVTTVDSNKLIDPTASEIQVPSHNSMRRSSCIDENGTTDRQSRLLDSFRRKLSRQNRRGAKLSLPVHPNHSGLKGSGDFSDSCISAYNDCHNSMRRSSCIDENGTTDRQSRLLDSFRRKLSRQNRRGAKLSLPVHPSHSGLKGSGDFSDSCISAYNDWYERNGVSPNPPPKLEPMKTTEHQSNNHHNHENNDTQKGGIPPPPSQNASWTVNEMLPVIQEEDQMSRKMTQYSMNGSTSNSDNDNNHKTSQTTLSTETTASMGDIRMSQDELNGSETPDSIQKVKNVLQKAEDVASNFSIDDGNDDDDVELHHHHRPTVIFEHPLPSHTTAPAELAATEIDQSSTAPPPPSSVNATSIPKSRTFGGRERPEFRLASESDDNTP